MKITTYTQITYGNHVGIKTDEFHIERLPALFFEMTSEERYDYLNDGGFWVEGTDDSPFDKDGSQTETVIEIAIEEWFTNGIPNDRSTVTAPPEDGNRLFIGTCDTCNYLGTVYFTGGIGDDETVCLTCYNQTTAAQRQDVRNVLASSVIADAAPIDAKPTPTAYASAPLGSAVSVCIGGDFGGWVVYCTDNSSEWVEGLFPDQDSAQRFADVYTQEGDNTATPLLIMTANREGWSR
jgi:hypothetical protein